MGKINNGISILDKKENNTDFFFLDNILLITEVGP